jgi:hypothetical protein
MRRFFAALVFLLFAVTAFAQTRTIAPSAPTAFKNGTINFTCTANCGTGGTWSCSGCAGSINSSTGAYPAQASITAQQQLAAARFFLHSAHRFFVARLSFLLVTAEGGRFLPSGLPELFIGRRDRRARIEWPPQLQRPSESQIDQAADLVRPKSE